jgi:molybdopterin-binding protein
VSDAILAAHDVTVEYAARTILKIDRLAVRRGETLALIGPNGAGKSTLLRVMGLLERPARGEIRLDGRPIAWGRDLLPARRRFASVFQEPLLADTTVERNVALGLALRHVPGDQARRRAGFWIDRFGITPLARRQARTLSGGEAQRTSLARAFAIEPDVLLLDEPFSALDPPTREDLLRDLQRVLRETAVTTVFVTHDRNEALRLGDRVGVMLEGRLAQLDTPEVVFGRPAGPDVARFVGVENLVPGRVARASDGLLAVDTGTLCVLVPGELAVGRPVMLCIRPEEVVLQPGPTRSAPDSALNHFPGRVAELVPVGMQVRVLVECGRPLIALVTRRSVHDLSLQVGSEVTLSFKASAVHLIEREDVGASR